MGQPVVHFEINGPDSEKLKSFYGALFDWKIDSNNPYNYGMIDTGGGLNGGISSPPDGSRYITIYIAVPDLQAALDKAESLGGKTVMPPTEIPGAVTMALFADPAGNVTGLIKG